jgi:hypothetical protein
METNRQSSQSYPTTAFILALVGGILMVLCGLLLVAVSTIIIPHLPPSDFNTNSTVTLSRASIQGLASFVVGALGVFGLISGAIVVASAVMLQASPARRRTWGVLILVFSALSFLGLGGFVAGAVLGIVGGAMALRWTPKQQ